MTDRPTDRPTDHATRSVRIGHIYIRSTAMQPNNNTNNTNNNNCSSVIGFDVTSLISSQRLHFVGLTVLIVFMISWMYFWLQMKKLIWKHCWSCVKRRWQK